MDKRYQVFVSSTYEDLRVERAEVIQALLELDCFPSGMELFPAGDEAQWTVIQRVIEECDYYIVIIAGRYGSTGPDGKSYTQMEYEYAVSKGKPVMAFLHENPGSIAFDKTEQDPGRRKALEAFRTIARQRICKFWTSPKDLSGVVSRGIAQMKQHHPAVGWVRANVVAAESAAQEILRLRDKVEGFQKEFAELTPPDGTERLAQGDEEISLTFYFNPYGEDTTHLQMSFSWNRLFAALAPILLNKATEQDMRNKVIELFENRFLDETKYTAFNTYLRDEDFQQAKVQLLALGLIKKAGDAGYWTLTRWGTHVMTQIAAIPSSRQSKPANT